MTKSLLFFFIILCSVEFTTSQTFPYRHYTIKDGLPGSNILNFAQDEKGFIWFSTPGTLTRFNGYSFSNHSVSNKNDITGNFIINGDSKVYYLENNTGLRLFKRNKLITDFSDSGLNLPVNKLLLVSDTLFLFSDHEIHLLYNDRRIHSLKAKSKILSVLKKKDKSVIAGTEEGLFIYDYDSLKLFSPEIKFPVHSVSEDNEGNIWAGSYDRIYKLDGNRISKEIEVNVYKPFPIENLILDNFSNIWFSIRNYGLFVFKGDKLLHIGKNLGFGRSQINFIAKDSEENIWVGTYGKGLYCFHNLYISNYTEIDNLSHEFVPALALDNKGKLIIGTAGSIDIFEDNSIINLKSTLNDHPKEIKPGEGNRIFIACVSNRTELLEIINTGNRSFYIFGASALLPDKQNILITGDWENNLRYYLVSEDEVIFLKKIPLFGKRERINKIVKDSSGNLWIGSVSGLCLISNDSIKYFTDNEQLTSPVNDIYAARNHVWIATEKGISIYDGNKWTELKSYYNFDLTSAANIALDNEGNVWMNNLHGLVRLNPEGIKFWNENSGLISNEIRSLCFDSLSSSMWVGTNEGITKINLEEYSKIKPKPLDLYLTGVSIGDSLLQEYDKIKLDDDNLIRIEFVSLNYQNPGEIIYQYKFEGAETWNETGNPFIEFSSLTPGNYKLLLSSYTINRERSRELELSFVVREPFFSSVYFYSVIFFILVLLVVFLTEKRVRHIRNKENEAKETEKKISALKHQALAAMMNPHFIFNSLTSIQYFINNKEAEEANEYLAKFARLIRLNLESAEEGFISVKEELERLKTYLSLEKLRFGDSLEYTIKIDSEINIQDIQIPNMVIQPFVENAVWHGILPKNDKGDISITIEKFNKAKLRITIKDNGVGYKKGLELRKSGHISKGMKIIQERLELLNESREPLISIHDVNEYEKEKNGTIVVIILTPKLLKTISEN